MFRVALSHIDSSFFKISIANPSENGRRPQEISGRTLERKRSLFERIPHHQQLHPGANTEEKLFRSVSRPHFLDDPPLPFPIFAYLLRRIQKDLFRTYSIFAMRRFFNAWFPMVRDRPVSNEEGIFGSQFHILRRNDWHKICQK